RSEGKPAMVFLLALRQQSADGAEILDALAAVAPDDPGLPRRFAGWLASDPDAATRAAAALGLAKLDGGKDYVRSLASALRTDPADSVRVGAAKALGELGQDSQEVETALRLAKADSAAAVREAATKALAKLKKG